MNATQAAIRAGYSERTAATTASENLRKQYISEAVAAEQAKLAETIEITAEKVLNELASIGFVSPETDIGLADKVRVADKINALEKLGRHLALFTDKVEHSGRIDSDVSDLEIGRRIAGLLDKGSRVEYDA